LEQSGFGLVEETEADQAFEFRTGALDVFRQQRQVQREAQVAGAQRPTLMLENIHDLLASRTVRQHRGRRLEVEADGHRADGLCRDPQCFAFGRRRDIEAWIKPCNERRLRSALDCRPPTEARRAWQECMAMAG
jgi:hypothetical protein